MFVRFRQTKYRLQVSLIETRRVDGKVHAEHVAQLGSVEIPLTIESRLAFWQRLHERLAKLSNRVDATMHGKVLGAVHARIPMVTLDEQRAKQLENTESDERFWAAQSDMYQATADDQKGLAATVAQAIASMQNAAADAAVKATAAKERAERIKKGEDVPGGLGKPLTYEDIERSFREAGMTSDLRHIERVGELHRLVGDDGFKEIHRAINEALERTRHAVIRANLRAYRQLEAMGMAGDALVSGSTKTEPPD
jgi:hypothetical protein